jgi:D-alanine-D-alanine ligase
LKKLLEELKPIVWTLVPYWIEETTVTSDCYDLARYKIELAAAFQELALPWIWQVVVVGNIESVMTQIAECATRRPTLVLNLCDGYEDTGTPGISVVKALEAARLAFSGADTRFYETSSSKLLMKRLFRQANVPTAVWEELPSEGPVTGLVERLGQPLFIKPSESSSSQGIGLRSVVRSDVEAAARRDELLHGESSLLYANDILFAEDFIDGPEFTVLLVGYWDEPDNIWSLTPAERVFDESIPESERFLSYDRYWGFYEEETPPDGGRPFYRSVATGVELSRVLFEIAKQAYIAVWGCSYGRVDIRLNRKTNEHQVLEVNANCGLSASLETTCGHILKASGKRFPQLVEKILEHALQRSISQAMRSQKPQTASNGL